MELGPFRLGMRTLKTAFAVMICVGLFHYTNEASPMIAALSAVFALRQDLNTSISFARTRIIGNWIGGGFGLVFYFVQSRFTDSFWLELFFLPVLVILTIMLSNSLHNNQGIVSGIATLLIVSLGVPSGENFAYALQRVFDTFIGIIVAITLNSISAPPKETSRGIHEDLLLLKQKEAELDTLKKEIDQKIAAKKQGPKNF